MNQVFNEVCNDVLKPLNEKINISAPVIGIHHSPLSQKFGIPRQPNLVDIPTQIKMRAPYNTPAAFVGIEEYSHLWVTWQFHQNKVQDNFRPQVRPPRLGGNAKVGVFATRSMYRPSQLGLSVVKLDNLELVDGGIILNIVGADMLDGTPIIDIKPYIGYSDCLIDAKSSFAADKPDYKTVTINKHGCNDIQKIMTLGQLTEMDVEHIKSLISQDPRPAYRQKEVGSIFVMRYKSVDVFFMMPNLSSNLTGLVTLEIVEVKSIG